MSAAGFDYVWFWRSRLPRRKGQARRVRVRTRAGNSCLIEFEDGFMAVVSRNALRRREGSTEAAANPLPPTGCGCLADRPWTRLRGVVKILTGSSQAEKTQGSRKPGSFPRGETKTGVSGGSSVTIGRQEGQSGVRRGE
jgi:hypothetical protein